MQNKQITPKEAYQYLLTKRPQVINFTYHDPTFRTEIEFQLDY